MSIIIHSDSAKRSDSHDGQIGAGKDSAQEVGGAPPKATASRTKGQSRRAKLRNGPAGVASANLVDADTTELTSSASASPTRPKKLTKQDAVLELLRQEEGATIDELMYATAWQAHSLRGFLSGTVRKKLKLHLISDMVGNGVRRYRVVSSDQAGRGNEAGDQPATGGSAGAQGA